MGANQTALPKQQIDLKQWQFINETIDPRYGEIKIYKKHNSEQTVCYINRVTNIANLQTSPIQVSMSHPNLLKLHFFNVQVQKEMCSSFQKITLIYEYLTNDLKQNIQLRISKQVPYSLSQLWGLAKQLFSVTSYLKSYNIYHRDLLPANILIDDSGIIKIQDLTLLNKQLSGFHQVALGIREEYHLSPEELEGLNENKDINNPESSDIFQIGLTILEAATLDQINDIYVKEQIDPNVLQAKLNEVKNQYSEQFQQFLQKTLDLSPDRGIFEDYLDYLQNIQIDSNILLLSEDVLIFYIRLSPKTKKFNKSSQKQVDRNIWFVEAKDEPPANARLKSQAKMNSSFNSQPSNLNLIQTSNFNAVEKVAPKAVENMQLPEIEETQQIKSNMNSFRFVEQQPTKEEQFNQQLRSEQFKQTQSIPKPEQFGQTMQQFNQTLPVQSKSSKHSIQNSELKINRQALQQISSQNQISKTQNDEYSQKSQPMKLNYQNMEIYRSPPQKNNFQTIQFASPQYPQQFNQQYQQQKQFYQPIVYQQDQRKISDQYFFQNNTPATTKVQPTSTWNNSNTNIYDKPYQNNDIDSRIEEVLNKSKQALARFNSTISHMPQPNRMVNNRAEQNVYMNNQKQQPKKTQLNDDYIQNILAQAHYEIERSQKANGFK